MAADVAVSVDRDFARFGSKSFAINKINTVDVRWRHPHSRNAVLGWALLAVISLLLLSGGQTGAGLFLIVVFGLLAWRAYKRSLIVEYQLFLVTSSGSAQALTSLDGAMITEVRQRIESAMAGRLD